MSCTPGPASSEGEHLPTYQLIQSATDEYLFGAAAEKFVQTRFI